jgi:HIRAN domain
LEAVFGLFFALCCYLIYRALRGSQTSVPQVATPHIAYHGKSYPFSDFLDDSRLLHVRSIHTKIRGVTFPNADGSDRQIIIRQCCQSGDALYLVREPNNPVDRNAIQVRRIVFSDVQDEPNIGEQLGYLSRELAEELAPSMDEQGHVLLAHIMDVTGGDEGRNFGVNIQVEEYKPAEQLTTLASAAHPPL